MKDILGSLLLGAMVGFLMGSCEARAGVADDEPGIRARASLGTEIVHGQGYWSPTLRVGYDGGVGLRYGHMHAPTWAQSAKAELKLQSIDYYELDYEVCGQRWCAALGAAWLDGLTYMNGTQWNFGVHSRYAIDKRWSLVYDHYSHGSALGIAQDKSNRGWNLLGVAYTF